jgi:predicted nucleotidyltransferase
VSTGDFPEGYFSTDVREFLSLLHRHHVRYLVVGGEAVIHYGHARLTGDIDLFFEQTEANVESLFNALREFWGGQVPAVGEARELLEPNVVVQFGRPPNRIDLIGSLGAVPFAEAWAERSEASLALPPTGIPVPILGLRHLIRSKEQAGRSKDLEDLKFLRKRLDRKD